MASTITKGANGMLRGVSVASLSQTQEYVVGVALLPALTAITIPNGMTYVGAELSVFFGGQRMTVDKDYNYVGSGDRTQISMNRDLYLNESIIFRKEL